MTSVPKASGDELTVRKKAAGESKRGQKRLPTAIVSTSSKRIRQASELPTIRSTSLTDASLFLTAPGVLQTISRLASRTSEKVSDNVNQTKWDWLSHLNHQGKDSQRLWEDFEEYFSKFEDYRESAGATMDSVIQDIKADSESCVRIYRILCIPMIWFRVHQEKMTTNVMTLMAAVKSRPPELAQLPNSARRALIHLCGTFLRSSQGHPH